jgi:hypothetical protein
MSGRRGQEPRSHQHADPAILKAAAEDDRTTLGARRSSRTGAAGTWVQSRTVMEGNWKNVLNE